MLAHTGVVVSPDRHDDSKSSSASWTQATDAAKSTRKGTLNGEEQNTEANGIHSIRKRYQEEGFSTETASLLTGSWRPATKTAYNCYVANGKCTRSKNVPSPAEVANFLARLFTQDASYSAVKTARSALPAFLPMQNGRSVGSQHDVCRVVKGVFEARPSLPKYQKTWNVNIVLDHLDSLPEVEDTSLKQLTLCMCMPLTLLTGQ